MIEICVQKKLSAADGEMWLNLDCTVEEGRLITLYGKSGAGKTSSIRILAGLMTPDHGYIRVNEQIWFDKKQKVNLRPQARKIGFVFQDYALFPNMSVRENLSFALAKKQDSAIIDELIEVVELGDLQNKKPQTLSGGQKQRVALARALVQRPKVLMLDEPLSALDLEMRTKLQKYILSVHQAYSLTTFLISHDKSEIENMSNEVLVLDKGEIINRGTPEEIFGHTDNHSSIILSGKIIKIETLATVRKLRLQFDQGMLEIELSRQESEGLCVGDHIRMSLSPESRFASKTLLVPPN